MKSRHKWGPAGFLPDGRNLEHCDRCGTERTRDPATRSLHLYRRGRALPPSGRPLGEGWQAFQAGVIPKCMRVEADTPTTQGRVDWKARALAAEAANAALLKAARLPLLDASDPKGSFKSLLAAVQDMGAVVNQHHPGAALLAEVDGLRRQVELLFDREKHIAKVLDVADGGQYRNDWDGAVARLKASAHNAALEEAAKALEATGGLSRPAFVIRCLKRNAQ